MNFLFLERFHKLMNRYIEKRGHNPKGVLISYNLKLDIINLVCHNPLPSQFNTKLDWNGNYGIYGMRVRFTRRPNYIEFLPRFQPHMRLNEKKKT